ncbi:AMP-binding protein [Streptomyces sp. NPDC058157]|uniref:AMP-binding protein n=1 Tax=Streptomyces sp. NPDC058157 TaxID=3346360 RepID=UPI0036E8A6E7
MTAAIPAAGSPAAPSAPASSAPWPRLGDWSDHAELRSLQRAALPAALARARRSPFYAGRLTAGRTCLDGMRPTLKSDLRDAYPFGMLAVPGAKVATYHESSGTTGEPTASYLTENDWAETADRFNRSSAALTAEDRVLVKTPYSMATTAHQMHHAARTAGALVIPADNRTSMMTYRRLLRLVRDVRPTVTWSLPSEPLLWAAADDALGAGTLAAAAAGNGPRALVVAGEPLSPAKRARIGELWGGARVIEDYGSTETTSLAGECPHGRLHVWADRFLFEVQDPALDRITPAGRGRLLVTTLYREAMPLLRYDTGDLVVLGAENDCPCGWALPFIEVLGRDGAPVRVAGKAVRPHDVDALVYGLPVEYRAHVWRAVAEADRLRLTVEAGGDGEMHEEAAAKLRAGFAETLGLPVELTVGGPGTLIPPGALLREDRFVKPRFLYEAADAREDGWTYLD